MADPSLLEIEENNSVIFGRMVEEFKIHPDMKRSAKGKAS
jgi:hypothetical protein